MRTIDLQSWPRRAHFELFRRMEFGYAELCVQVDISELWARRKSANASATVLLTYVVTRAANRVPELRQRLRGDDVIEHEVIHPQITVLGDDELFGLCPLTYDPSFETFATDAAQAIEAAKAASSLDKWAHDPEGGPTRDDLLSITVVPWFSFSGFSITRGPGHEDVIPVLGWGKVVSSGEKHLLPLYINIHHSLVDGIHLARFFRFIEEESRALAGSF
ncbi:MAG: hypothetical protein JSW65_07045 [Candidatus Bipolaricaulota bacterium]|nr:MAG: hypothetical protein JSW65_07045 [Candidatus Bipolaricaulota bacterium]